MENSEKLPQPEGAPAASSDNTMEQGLPWQTKAAVGSVIGVVIVGGILVLAFACGSRRVNPPQQPQARRDAKAAAYGVLHTKTFGVPEAKVEVMLIVPLNIDCHAPTIEYLKKSAEACGAQVRVTFLELRSPEANDVFGKAGKDVCATVFVNGRWQVSGVAGKEVTLTGPLGDKYVLGDVRAAMASEMKQAYGVAALALPEAPVTPAAPPGARKGPPE